MAVTICSRVTIHRSKARLCRGVLMHCRSYRLLFHVWFGSGLLGIASVGCSSTEDASSSTGGNAGTPTSSLDEPDYAQAFPQDELRRLDLVMSPDHFQRIQDDMTSILGAFGSAGAIPMTGGFPGGAAFQAAWAAALCRRKRYPPLASRWREAPPARARSSAQCSRERVRPTSRAGSCADRLDFRVEAERLPRGRARGDGRRLWRRWRRLNSNYAHLRGM